MVINITLYTFWKWANCTGINNRKHNHYT